MLIFEYPITFDWDTGNSSKNRDKHNVSSEECEEVFGDLYKVIYRDLSHSIKENRFLLIGETWAGRLLFIVFTLRKDKIRVISARDLNKKEYKLYEKRT